jgi:hypothetical protein
MKMRFSSIHFVCTGRHFPLNRSWGLGNGISEALALDRYTIATSLLFNKLRYTLVGKKMYFARYEGPHAEKTSVACLTYFQEYIFFFKDFDEELIM